MTIVLPRPPEIVALGKIAIITPKTKDAINPNPIPMRAIRETMALPAEPKVVKMLRQELVERDEASTPAPAMKYIPTHVKTHQ